ncbi:UNVERIFIED_CONTAM: Serine carboxypeptidase-like 18 [Sesamum radiatum]|uniref:Serine carboxypeptidase-like 18 n=1 Tax=Sesamum radiatum TaxID=300843 RepID=A0AAW2RY47_SESRA
MSGDIHPGNEAGLEPQILLQGYIVGNSFTDKPKDINERVPYAHRMALISDEQFELAKSSCDGKYVNPDPVNIKCLNALRLVDECTKHINDVHILEPKCKFMSPRPIVSRSRQLFLEDDPVDLLSLSKQEKLWCRHSSYVTSYVWANNETVREALQIRQGTVSDWIRCNRSLSYEEDVPRVFKHHQLLNEKGFQALAYSGDHDMIVPYMSTLNWVRDLNLTLDEDWRPWIVDSQVAGYTMKYKNNPGEITFATVKARTKFLSIYFPSLVNN